MTLTEQDIARLEELYRDSFIEQRVYDAVPQLFAELRRLRTENERRKAMWEGLRAWRQSVYCEMTPHPRDLLTAKMAELEKQLDAPEGQER